MPSRLPLALLVLLALLAGTGVRAATSSWLDKAHALHLADSPFWRVLVYYQPDDAGYRSHVRSQPAFFLSADGEHSPGAELDATLQTWLGETASAPDMSVACRFPARVAWLRDSLGITAADHPDAPCPELELWLSRIKPWQATLVFPSAYLNNPSSMFGHTLLRLDAPDQTEETRLLAYAVNYAAETRESNGLLFAVKGLTGGYPGGFSLMPYYEKVKEYSSLENRDLWEYQLTLTPDEVRRLLLHLWEMRSVHFPYYFFSDNCSYELMWLLDSARPGLTLHTQFPFYAIPVDTVRALLRQQGMLKAITYRPSNATQLESEIAANSPGVNAAATTLLQNAQADLGALDTVSQARAAETAYDVLYYRFLDRDAPLAGTPVALRALLLRRSQIDVPDQRNTPAQPAADPAHGHETARWSLSSGVDQGQAFALADIRPAYHDLLDAPGGYVQGARIDFLDTGLRYLPQTTQLQVDHFTLIAIDSLAPRDAFLKPLSWGLAAGQRRVPLDAAGRFDARGERPVAYGEGQVGLGESLGTALCYAQLKAGLEAAQAIRDGWRVGIGPRLGCLGSAGDDDQWQAELQSLHESDDSRWLGSLELGWQHQLGIDNALRLGASVDTGQGRHTGRIKLGWLHYF